MSLLVVTFYSCGDDDNGGSGSNLTGNWAERSTFDEEPRSSATSFTIGNRGYMGTGYDGDNYLNDFWTYDMASNSWQQLADFEGVARSSAVSFVIGNQGFIGTGYDGESNEELADFYKYDVASNTWEQIADYSGTARYGAVGFNSDTRGYVGTGFDGSGDKKDFHRYDPATDTWEQVFGFGGDKRRDGTTFSIGTDVYLLSGVSNGIYEEDFWVFDTTTETWTALDDIDSDTNAIILRANAVGFTLNGMGYIATGEAGATLGTVWEFDPADQSWTERTQFERLARRDAIAMSNGERAFVALGRNGTLYFDDNMEFFPTEEQNDDDN